MPVKKVAGFSSRPAGGRSVQETISRKTGGHMPRQRKSIALHLVDGTLRPRHEGRRDPQTTGPLPQQPPRYLPRAAKVAWRELHAAMPRGGLANCDVALFEAAAASVASYRRWTKEAATAPMYDDNPNGGLRTHPAHVEQRRQRAALQDALIAIGFSPAARCRIVAPPDDGLDPAAIARLLRGEPE